MHKERAIATWVQTNLHLRRPRHCNRWATLKGTCKATRSTHGSASRWAVGRESAESQLPRTEAGL